MEFQLKPQIYSLLLCRSAREDRQTGGWILQPFSEIRVKELPVLVQFTAFIQIMGPAGRYELHMRLLHSADLGGALAVLPPRPFTLQEGKNLDFAIQLQARLMQTGLHILEAAIPDYCTMPTPLRVTGSIAPLAAS